MRRNWITFCLSAFVGFACLAQEEKIEPRVDIYYAKHGDDVPIIKVTTRKRIERRFFHMEGMKVKVYFGEESKDALVGEVTTNKNGEGKLEVPTDLMDRWHHADEFEFIATVDESDSTAAVTESIAIMKARIRLDADADSTVTATLEQKAAEGWTPVPEVEVKLFVKRSFGRLPLTEDYLETDEGGQVSFQFEGSVPGDAAGKLVIGAMIEEHDDFGSVYSYQTTSWGVPTIDDNTAFEERTLWAPRDKTPLWLLIFPNLIIITTWAILVYLLLLIIRIKKLGKRDTTNT